MNSPPTELRGANDEERGYPGRVVPTQSTSGSREATTHQPEMLYFVRSAPSSLLSQNTQNHCSDVAQVSPKREANIRDLCGEDIQGSEIKSIGRGRTSVFNIQRPTDGLSFQFPRVPEIPLHKQWMQFLEFCTIGKIGVSAMQRISSLADRECVVDFGHPLLRVNGWLVIGTKENGTPLHCGFWGQEPN